MFRKSGGGVNPVFLAKPDPGQQIFTSSGTFTVPKRVKSVDIFLVGGGGAGGSWESVGYNWWGNGGGGGYTTTAKGVSVTPQASYDVIVGAGDVGRTDVYANTIGGTSLALGYSASGGWGGLNGLNDDSAVAGCGGSGGGDGCYTRPSCGGQGGSDGSNGYGRGETTTSTFGTYRRGQGVTTRAFGESSGTLYAGGGGGSSAPGYTRPAGGAGGGGWGSTGDPGWGSNGTDGTGGGGGANRDTGINNKHRGGSGCVIIRWGY